VLIEGVSPWIGSAGFVLSDWRGVIMKQTIFVFVAMFLVIPCGARSSGIELSFAAKPQAGADTKPVRVTAAELFKAYQDNAAAADAKYKGKTLVIAGRIDKLHLDESSGKSLVGFHVVEGKYPPQIVCYVEASQKDQFAKASGDIELVGTCQGRFDVMGYYQGFVVMLEECRLTKK
jgi:hypothetical protein